MTHNSSLIINDSHHLNGEINIPGDKSITHRAIILGALSNGKLNILNALLSEDCQKTITALSSLGAKITLSDSAICIDGRGLNSLKKPSKIIDAGNSGTLARLISGILATQSFDSSLTGDESLIKRPMKRVIDPLITVGAKIASDKCKLPLSFVKSSMQPINHVSSIASAQVKSCLLLAALFIDGESQISENVKTRDHTERMLEYLNYPISINNNIISITGKKVITAKDITIPSDISSAAFFIVAALIKNNSNITLQSVGVNPLRTGIIDVLTSMGADIKVYNNRTICNEPVSDISVKSSKLKPIKLSGDIISRLIDELPILFVACACCDGTSVIEDIEELRLKESDRIKSMEDGLTKLGIKVESTPNSISITGGIFNGGIINSYSDHRVAMSFIIAGLVSSKSITVLDTDNINTSFPDFAEVLKEQNIEIYNL